MVNLRHLERAFWLRLLAAITLLGISAGGRPVVCVEADGRVHVESGAETCCAATPIGTTLALGGGLALNGDGCGTCRDIVPPVPQGKAVDHRSPAAPLLADFTIAISPDPSSAPNRMAGSRPPGSPSPILAALQTVFICC